MGMGAKDVLKINKKRLRTAKALEWGGMLVMLASIFLVRRLMEGALCLTLAGGAVSIAGALMLDKLYRCPSCAGRLLVVGSGIDKMRGRTPPHCPSCGAAIQVVIESSKK